MGVGNDLQGNYSGLFLKLLLLTK